MKEAQQEMAKLIYNLYKEIKCKVIIVDFGNSRNAGKWDLKKQKDQKNKNISYFYLRLIKYASQDGQFKEHIYQFKHFSNMRFTRDLVEKINDIEKMDESMILSIGKEYSRELFEKNLVDPI